MNGENSRPASGQSGLRSRAEVVAGGLPRPAMSLSHDQMLHELQVHQVELEMQADELRAANDRLEELARRYRDLFELAPFGYLSTDFDCTIVEANHAAEAILGTPRSQMIGSKLAVFVVPEHATTLHLHRRATRENPDSQRTELCVQRRDGSVVDVQVQSARGEHGLHSRSALIDVTHLKTVERNLAERTRHLSELNEALISEMAARDATKRELAEREARRRNAEAALERQRSFAERLIEAVPAIVLSLDSEGKVLGFNARMSQLSGYAVGDVIGDDWLEWFVLAEARGEAREAFSRALGGGQAPERALVVPMPTKSGRIRQIEWYYATLENQAGETSGLVAIGQDITERMRAEEELRQAHKMEAVGTLASGISHDFNNVLTGIIGCADVAMARLPAASSARAPLNQVKASALGGAQIIQRLMAFARKQPAERKVVNINLLVQRTETMLRHLLGEDMELHMSLLADNAAVSCQPDEIEQVLMNLCANARHAAPHGGQLDLVTREVRVEDGNAAETADVPRGNYVVIEVSDNGSGMDAKTRERLFEPFFTTKEPGHGTGLGLASVYVTLRNHGGHVRVETELGHGTKFTLYFPQSDEEPKASTEAPDADVPLSVRPSGETVLVVEDEPLVRLAMRHYLERHGYEVLEAAHCGEVERILGEHAGSIDVLLTDTVLPGKSGPDIAELVRSREPGVRTIYVSAHPNEMLISQGRLPSGVTTLQKPFTEAALILRVREAGRGDCTVPKAPRAPIELLETTRLLLVEDDEDTRVALGELLTGLGYEVLPVADGRSALERCEAPGIEVDVVITDVTLPDVDGVELARLIRGSQPEVGVVFISGYRVDDVPGLRSLASEPRTAFLQKPVEISKVENVLAEIRAELRIDRRARSNGAPP